MKLAFCLFNYFPFGGLQRDFLRIANACVQAGHEVHVYTQSWAGEKSPGLSLHIHPGKGWTNHGKAKNFAKKVQKLIATEAFDRVIGFNKMPHLNVYYAADTCYQAKARTQRGAWYRLTPRYRQMIAAEKAVFSPQLKTRILLISAVQQAEFSRFYGTQSDRFYLLPPGIACDIFIASITTILMPILALVAGIGLMYLNKDMTFSIYSPEWQLVIMSIIGFFIRFLVR